MSPRLSVFAALAVLTAGCDVADASLSPSAPEAAAFSPHPDVVLLHDIIGKWDAAQREQARLASVTLLTNCPYNRSVFQVPIVLEHAVRTTDPASLPPEVAKDWAELAAHLADHVAVMDRLAGPELVQPGFVDYNFGLEPGSTPSRAELLADPDPLARTAMLQAQIDDRVMHMPPVVYAEVTKATESLRALTADGWPPTYLLEPTRDRLTALTPKVKGTPLEGRVKAMLALVDKHRDQGC